MLSFIMQWDMQVAGVRVEDTENSLNCKAVIRCGNPWKGTSRKEKKKMVVNGLLCATFPQHLFLHECVYVLR